MAKVHKKFSAHKELLKRIPKDRSNPNVRIRAVFQLLQSLFRDHNFDLRPGTPDLGLAIEAVLMLLHEAFVLNKIGCIWDNLDTPPIPDRLVPQPDAGERWRNIQEQRELLRSGEATQQDLLRAMTTVDDTFTSMATLFARGRLDSDWALEVEDAGLQRDMCTATLPVMKKMLDEIWRPLLSEFKHVTKRRLAG